MVMERNFQRGRKLEGSGRRKNRVEVSQNKKKKKRKGGQYTAPERLQPGDVPMGWQSPVFRQSVKNPARGPWLPWLREKGLILPAVFEPT